MDSDSVSPKSQPLSKSCQPPPLSLPDPWFPPTPVASRESSVSTVCMKESWPGKWNPPMNLPSTPPLSYEDLTDPALSTLELTRCPTPAQTPPQASPSPKWLQYVKRLQPALHLPYRKPKSRPSPPSPSSILTLRSLTRSMTNNRCTTIVMRDLDNLLTTLHTQQYASGCALKAHPQTADNDAWILEALLNIRFHHGAYESDCQGVHALHRACKFVVYQAGRDISDLDEKAGTAGVQNVARFIEKWDHFPPEAFEGMRFKHDVCTPPSPPPTMNGALDVGNTQVQDAVIASCLDFVGVYDQIRIERNSIRVRGRADSYGGNNDHGENDHGAGSGTKTGNGNGNGNGTKNRSTLSHCAGTITLITTLLRHVLTELAAESHRRNTCVHAPTTSAHICQRQQLSSSDTEIWVGRECIEGMLRELEQVRRQWPMTMTLGRNRGRGFGKREGKREWDEEEMCWWSSLAESDWEWGLTMGADEIVGNICRGTWVDGWGRRQG